MSRKQDTDTDALELMTVSSKRGIGKIISAKNYVGLITMSDGTAIEILPKLYTKDKESSEVEIKRVFLDMLKFLKEIPYKTFNISSLHIEKNNIFEIFIRMFIQEIYTLVKRGLKSAYIEHQDNEYFYKGRINFSQHIKSNFAHKERFYIEYDIFSVDRTENKLIKTTLEFLRKVSSCRKNKKDLRTLLTAFETVDYSIHPDQDFTKITFDRNMKEYETILKWCSIFLKNKSFTTFKGSDVAYALLFPMERVFENYVAGQLNKVLDKSYYQIKIQDQSYHLFDDPKRFLLKPDIVVQDCNSSIVLDTKWKLLYPNQSNYGVSQADMYQVYAYNKKYSSKMIFLLYPWTTAINNITEPITYQSRDDVTVRIGFIDLININNSIRNLALEIDEMMRV
ncbi:McrC family protein [Aneurinibacillus soli]|uniref:McrC family protein n=1 Tax=Aneurinibacillus soli TaxID=1500254 RepID=UPI0018D587EE|nr:McrC family protein [Aneurinibacillus soli]